MPRLSVLVPVRNEAAHIQRTLQGLAQQDLPADEYEVLVIDGDSTDATCTLVHDMRLPNVTLLHNPKRLASAARNIGVQHARGDYILIVDGHCEIRDPHHLSNVLDAFTTSGADCLGRPQPLRSAQPSPWQRCVGAARMSWLGHNPHSAIFSPHARLVPADNVAVAYRREVFEVVGLFDEAFDACEDVDFNTRVRQAGFTCYFTPTITVAYQPRASLRALFYQMSRYGRGRSRLARKHPATITLPSLVPPLWLLWLLLGGVAACFSPATALVYAGTVASYALVVLAEAARVAVAERVPPWRLPFVFLTIHAGFGWGYWRELFVPTRRPVPTPAEAVRV